MRSVLIVLAIALNPTTARAIHFSWERGPGAEECPGPDAMRQGVRDRLGRDPFVGPEASRIHAVARRGGSPPVWEVEISSRRGRTVIGTRRLSSRAAGCNAVAEATILAVSLLIGEESRSDEAERVERLPPPWQTPAREPALEAASAPEPTDQPRRTRPFLLSASLSGGLGWLPHPALGPELRGSLPLAGPMRLDLSTLYFPEQSVQELTLSSVTFGARGCGEVLAIERVFVDLCGGLAVGAIFAAVRDVAPLEVGERGWGAVDASAALTLLLAEPLWLYVAFEGAVPFVRYRFRIENREGVLFQQTPVIGRTTLGVGVGFR